MKNKRIISTILLLFIFLALPMQVLGEESVTVGIAFTVENTPGTVVIEGVDGAPLPAQTEMGDVLEGTFEITFSKPGDYSYKVYQKQGLDDYTAYYESYDETVYDIVVSVFREEDDTLYGVVTASVGDDTYKPDGVVFVNESEKANLTIEKKQALNDETPTTKQISVQPGDKITYHITVSNNTEGSVYDVTVADEIPESLELVAGSITNEGIEANRVVSWNLGTMGPGDAVTVSFTTTVPAMEHETTWSNVATGTFLNQTGRVTISTQTMGLTESSVGALSTMRFVKKENALRLLDATRNTQVIEKDTNEVVAVYSPITPPPQTGDNSNIPLLIAIEAVSLVGIILFLFLFFKRRNKDEEEEQNSELN